MKFKTYQERALSTAVPTALSLDYVVPMIIGEVGELFGAQAKAVRDGWAPERTAKELAKEYGDIAWGTAVALSLVGVPPHSSALMMQQDTQGGLALLHHHASCLLQYPWDIDDTLRELWGDLEASCLAITSHTFDQVLEINLAKLTDRANRGTIQGSGNDR